LGLGVGPGCNAPAIEQRWESPAGPASEDVNTARSETTPAGPATSQPSPADTPIAVVNGQVISRGQFMNLLVASHGLRILEYLIHLNTARQRAAQPGNGLRRWG